MRWMWVLMVVGLAACGGPSDPDEVHLDEVTQAIESVDTWDHATAWPQADDTLHPSGGYADIRWNTLAYNTLDAQAGGDMPVGAIVHKVTSQDEQGAQIDGVTTMMKLEDGWFWAAFDANGDPQSYGAAARSYCEGCHTAGQDMVLVVTW